MLLGFLLFQSLYPNTSAVELQSAPNNRLGVAQSKLILLHQLLNTKLVSTSAPQYLGYLDDLAANLTAQEVPLVSV